MANSIMFVPSDPRLIPDALSQETARQRLAEFAPNAEVIGVRTHESIQFFDSGANFERVYCPVCQAEINFDWWLQQMDTDYQDGFVLREYSVPCCGATRKLDDLTYFWSCAFGRFELYAINAGLGLLESYHQRDIEAALGTEVRVVYKNG